MANAGEAENFWSPFSWTVLKDIARTTTMRSLSDQGLDQRTGMSFSLFVVL